VRENAGLCFTPVNASRATSGRDPGRSALLSWPARIICRTVLARTLWACLGWRNATARHPGTPGVLTALRRDRARVRPEPRHRQGRSRPQAA
jgi:hypothetical protein